MFQVRDATTAPADPRKPPHAAVTMAKIAKNASTLHQQSMTLNFTLTFDLTMTHIGITTVTKNTDTGTLIINITMVMEVYMFQVLVVTERIMDCNIRRKNHRTTNCIMEVLVFFIVKYSL